jgi:hypothetical protein
MCLCIFSKFPTHISALILLILLLLLFENEKNTHLFRKSWQLAVPAVQRSFRV